jgi:hypothetical protein
MRVDCTGTQERQANLAVWALKKLTCTTPTPLFCEKSPQRIENKGPALQKATKSSEDIDINRDKPEMRGESGVGGVSGAKCPSVLKRELDAVESRKSRHLGMIREGVAAITIYFTMQIDNHKINNRQEGRSQGPRPALRYCAPSSLDASVLFLGGQ